MPFRNTESYLRECLESICAQSETCWELIAVNDHSDDGSRALVQSFAERDSRVKVLDSSGTGIIGALQTAYAAATGNFITRMDSDDVMPVQKLATLKKLLEAHGPGNISTGHVQYFSAKPLGEGYALYQDWLNGLCMANNHFSAIYKECVIPSPCWMLWRQDFEAVGAFNANIYPEDYELCFRFYKAGLNVVSSPEVLHHWRDYDNRTSRTHAHYADQSFFHLKLDYFFELDRKAHMPLLVWGGGKKGKLLAKMLHQRGTTFTWMCNNPNKIGHEIGGVLMHDYETTHQYRNPQLLIGIANAEKQQEIIDYLSRMNLKHNHNFFFFC